MEFFFHELEKDVLILKADGGLNADTARHFVAELERIIDGGARKIIIDCESLEYISSYGLAVLIRLHKKLAQHGGDVRLASVKGVVVKILRVTRLDRFFSIYPDTNQARLSFRPASA